MAAPMHVWIDRGGTFTDCIGRDPATGETRVAKVLSGDDAPIRGVRALLELDPDAPLPPCDVRMGTTLATNALLERKGARCVLVVQAGFGDLLALDDQTRPALFDLSARRPAPLTDEVIEVEARVDATGRELTPLNVRAVRSALEAARERGAEAVVVALLHAPAGPAHERAIAAVAREVGFEQVSCSHEASASAGLLARAQTALVDAYLTPVLRRYLARLGERLPGSRLRLMQSSGDLVEAGRFRGKDAILSGPAGGVVACARIAEQAGRGQVLGFDMGGTSTDVSRWAGDHERQSEARVAGVRIRAPMIAVHTVASGGGSLCRFDGRRFTVGPESAGAEPGPLCYGHAEAREPALTDVALALGRLRGDRFPFALDAERARAGVAALAERAGLAPAEAAEGLFAIAVEQMAAAIGEISTARGHDPREHALVLFGGAAGQYGCAVARRLGVRTILSHPWAGVLSAFGMGVAPVGWHGEAPTPGALGAERVREAQAARAELEREGRAALEAAEGPDEADATTARAHLGLRYRGTETPLDVPLAEGASPEALREAFEARHRRRFGYARAGHPVEATRLRVHLERAAAPVDPPPARAPGSPAPFDRAPLHVEEGWREVDVWRREDLPVDAPLAGPLLVLEDTGSLVVEPGFVLRRRPDDLVVLEDARGVPGAADSSERRTSEPADSASENDEQAARLDGRQDGPSGAALDTRPDAGPDAQPDPGPEARPVAAPDPVRLEVFGNLFMSIAERMGAVLQRTALSTNIRDRLDFSCALFDGAGQLVANAPHIPVHLGSMGASVRAVRARHPRMAPGDVFVTNDPADGGSHLPDITLVAPVFVGERRFFVASRGHHADVGGVTPGSMPPFSTRLVEEGVVFRGVPLLRGGELEEAAVRAVLEGGSHPARRPEENLADLQAQLAACRTGARLLEEACAREGAEAVAAYMGHVQDQGEAAVREALAALDLEGRSFEDALDDGSVIHVRLARAADGRVRIDFRGSAAAHPGNLNAPRAVTTACVLYVLRTLVERPIPLNAGCLRAVELVVPPGSLLDPPAGAAVAGGNVETSQRIVDVLLGAFGRAAASQGTMNNLTLGDGRFGYYETVAGGAGAGEGWDGGSAAHTHMTNSRITDPEILEQRFPVRVRRHALRRGSGGAGRWRGGDGVVRELEALRPLQVSVLSERRARAPWGLAGGAPGAKGRNVLVRADGSEEELGGRLGVELVPGEAIRLETPGGGGYGEAP